MYPDSKSQDCCHRIIFTMVPKLVLQNQQDILYHTHVRKYHKIAIKNAFLNFSFSALVFLVNSVECSSCFQICTLACTLAIAVQRELLSCAIATTFVPLPYPIIIPLKKIKTKKQDSVALGMRFRIQTTGKCESWAATCETVSCKF